MAGAAAREVNIEELGAKFKECMRHEFAAPTAEDVARLAPLIREILAVPEPIPPRMFMALKKKYKFMGKNSFLFQIYLILRERWGLNDDYEILRQTLQIKPCKSWSGVTSITVFTAAHPEYTDPVSGERVTQAFSCHWNCHYCPNQPGQPRSYIDLEPGVLRANRNEFDCARQMWDRMRGLYMTGHGDLDKLEVLVLGGTLASYPEAYIEEFCRDIYYAANTFWSENKRPRQDLEEEKALNQYSKSRVIGLTLETRPDTITPDFIRRLRYYGCTRVQLGIQHVDDDVLEKINRRCPSERTIAAIKLLKENCYKIDGHFMPNLPGATVEKDRRMLIDVIAGLRNVPRYACVGAGAKAAEEWQYYDLKHPEYALDQLKIYPCEITPWTEIEKWYREGTYVQYPEADLIDTMILFKSLVFPWIRINRARRDIPDTCIISGNDSSNMRQQLQAIMAAEGKRCACIRCREVKNADWDGSFVIIVRVYNASEGREYFISAESQDQHVIYGFARLRLDSARDKIFPELEGAALIRELHVYGRVAKIKGGLGHTQHRGIGRHLISRAEEIARAAGYSKIAVIAGEGTRPYYRDKLGFHDEGHYMTKNFQ